MSDMRFDSNNDEFGRPPAAERGDFADKLVSWGLVGDRQTAIYTLIGIGVLALVGAFLLFNTGGSDAPPLLPQ